MKKALLIGINYNGTSSQLHGCVNDVKFVSEMLVDKYGYLRDNIVVLTDETPIKPTREAIMNGFNWLCSGESGSSYNPSKKAYNTLGLDNSKLFFYYSGHGSYVRDTSGDESDGRDELIVPIDFKYIYDDEIRSYLINRVPETVQLVTFFDSCFSGTAVDLLWLARETGDPRAPLQFQRDASYCETKGRVIYISGCSDTQYSIDTADKDGVPCGALSYSVRSVLASNSYSITIESLLLQVKKFLKDNKLSTQTPCLSFGRLEDIRQPFSP